MEQDHEDGRHPIAFISMTSNQHEQNYAAHDLELLGIVYTLQTWRFYLHGHKFVVHTDHHLLKYLETQEFLTPRQVHRSEPISMFDFGIVPIRGKSNQVSNGLSRQKSRANGPNKHLKELPGRVMKITCFVGALSALVPGSKLITINQTRFLTKFFDNQKNHLKSKTDFYSVGYGYVHRTGQQE